MFSNISALPLGTLLKIVFDNGVNNQLSSDYRDFEMVKRFKSPKSSLAREFRFQFLGGYGPSAIQWRNPGTSNRAFPRGAQSSISEKTAYFKEINATIELEQNLYARAQKSPEKYAEPLALEIESKATASKRDVAKTLYADGTGVAGTVLASSFSVSSPNSSVVNVALDVSNASRGHIGMFEYDDIYVILDADSTATALDTNLATEPAYWKVVDKEDREDQVVKLQGLDANFAPVATISAINVQPAAGAVFYKYDQPTKPDLTSIADYGTVSEVMAGLESLASADGRSIHGITMSGSNAATVLDCGGNSIDTSFVQRGMSKVKNRVGQDRYKWKMMSMAPETLDSFIESRETDRRFNSVEDGTRGTRKFMYQHLNDSLECYTTEYIAPKRLYVLPEQKSSEKVLEFHGSDFETVKDNSGNDWHLKPASGGGHVNMMISYLQAVGVLICKHPASILRIENFTNA